MRQAATSLFGLLLLSPALAAAQDAPRLHASYGIYAAGFHVADVEATFGIGARAYDARLSYHTTGLVGFFHHGEQTNSVVGKWDAGRPRPLEYQSNGIWQGVDRAALIDYSQGDPIVRRLIPPQESEREPVPLPLQRNSIDSLSALALLIRQVADTARCEAAVRTFDGNRATEITAHTAGEEMLPVTDRSVFSGRALHCDFVVQVLAGFLRDDSSAYDRRPTHGAAWLASLVADAPPVPVQLAFDTRWFGQAHIYLTRLELDPAPLLAKH
jgi:hypothetical protein